MSYQVLGLLRWVLRVYPEAIVSNVRSTMNANSAITGLALARLLRNSCIGLTNAWQWITHQHIQYTLATNVGV